MDAQALLSEEIPRSSLLPLLPRWQSQPSSLTEVLQVLVKGRAFSEAQRLLRFLRHEELEINIIHYNCAICAAERASSWRCAASSLAEMQHLGVSPDVISFNTVLSSMAHWRRASQIFQALQHQSLQSEATSVNSLLSSCEKSSAWATALLLFQKALSAPDLFAHSAVIGACCKISAAEVLGRSATMPTSKRGQCGNMQRQHQSMRRSLSVDAGPHELRRAFSVSMPRHCGVLFRSHGRM